MSSALQIFIDVARELERAVQLDTEKLDCTAALLKLQEEWRLDAVFLFTSLDKENPDRFQIHSLTTEKATPFHSIDWDADSVAFVADVIKKVVMPWRPLDRLAYRRDPLWELIWQSMELGPYPGPSELCSVVLRRQPSMDFAGLLVCVRNSSSSEREVFDLDYSLKLLAHQFFTAERWHSFKAALTSERAHVGSQLYASLLSRARGDFAHGVFAQLQTIGLLVVNTQSDIKKGNITQANESLDAIDGLKEQIFRLVKDVLSAGSPPAGEPATPIARPDSYALWADVAASVGLIEDTLSPLARMSKKTIVVRLEQPSKVPINKQALDEILSNLVHNAIKYSADLTKIKISLTHTSRRSMIDVTSYGIPILPGDRERIFERGFRTAQAAQISLSALGIGLFQARRLAGASGALLFVHSSEKLAEANRVNIVLQGHEQPAFRNTFRLLFTR